MVDYSIKYKLKYMSVDSSIDDFSLLTFQIINNEEIGVAALYVCDNADNKDDFDYNYEVLIQRFKTYIDDIIDTESASELSLKFDGFLPNNDVWYASFVVINSGEPFLLDGFTSRQINNYFKNITFEIYVSIVGEKARAMFKKSKQMVKSGADIDDIYVTLYNWDKNREIDRDAEVEDDLNRIYPEYKPTNVKDSLSDEDKTKIIDDLLNSSKEDPDYDEYLDQTGRLIQKNYIKVVGNRVTDDQIEEISNKAREFYEYYDVDEAIRKFGNWLTHYVIRLGK